MTTTTQKHEVVLLDFVRFYSVCYSVNSSTGRVTLTSVVEVWSPQEMSRVFRIERKDKLSVWSRVREKILTKETK